MKTGLVIPIYNRPQYAAKCFASLERMTTFPDVIVLVDDGSTEELPTLKLRHRIKRHENNTGVKGSLLTGCEYLFSQNCDLVINLDSDAIVKPDFMQRLTELHAASGKITSGFNNPKEPFLPSKLGGWNCLKAHANGINMCFNREQYDDFIKPALLQKTGNWDYVASEKHGSVAITVPSVVQHIGMQSSMGHKGADVAHDFKALSLPDVTLFGIDGYDVPGITRAAEISQRDIEFGAVNIITKDLFTKGGSAEQRRRDYSRFMLKDLAKQFDTSHVLTIHADGYVVNWDAWDNEWLKYDYIGATWLYKDGKNVGNGGFSLRSKKLCKLLAECDIDTDLMHPEDHAICRTYRRSLEQYGIIFAPEEVANKFSIEAYGCTAMAGASLYSGQFGFHSVHVDFSQSDIPEDKRIMAVRPAPPKTPKRVLRVR